MDFLSTGLESLVSAGQSLFSSFGNWIGDKLGISTNARQLKSSKELSKYNNELNFDTWNKQFDLQNQRQDELLYNQASMQKQGLINAGLNPAMMNQSSPSLAAVSSPSGGNSSGSSAGQAQNDILPMMQLAIQNKIADSEIVLNEAKANEANSNSKYKDEELAWYGKRVAAEIGVNNSTASNLDQQASATLARLYMDHQKLQPEIDKMKAETHLFSSEEAKNLIDKDYMAKIYDLQLETMAVNNNVSRVQIMKLYAEIENLAKVGANLDADTKNKAQEWLLIHNNAAIAGSEAKIIRAEADSWIKQNPTAAHYIDQGINVLTSLVGVAGTVTGAGIIAKGQKAAAVARGVNNSKIQTFSTPKDKYDLFGN